MLVHEMAHVIAWHVTKTQLPCTIIEPYGSSPLAKAAVPQQHIKFLKNVSVEVLSFPAFLRF